MIEGLQIITFIIIINHADFSFTNCVYMWKHDSNQPQATSFAGISVFLRKYFLTMAVKQKLSFKIHR